MGITPLVCIPNVHLNYLEYNIKVEKIGFIILSSFLLCKALCTCILWNIQTNKYIMSGQPQLFSQMQAISMFFFYLDFICHTENKKTREKKSSEKSSRILGIIIKFTYCMQWKVLLCANHLRFLTEIHVVGWTKSRTAHGFPVSTIKSGEFSLITVS